jgi:hypothetical protein
VIKIEKLKGRYPNTREFSEQVNKRKMNASNKASGQPPPPKKLE